MFQCIELIIMKDNRLCMLDSCPEWEYVNNPLCKNSLAPSFTAFNTLFSRKKKKSQLFVILFYMYYLFNFSTYIFCLGIALEINRVILGSFS